MSTKDFRTEPVDPPTAERLAAAGLRMDLLDTDDTIAGEPLDAAGELAALESGWR